MRTGVVFPQTQIGSDPLVIRDFFQTAEGLGFSHALAFDHVLGVRHDARTPPLWGPYDETHPFHEPLTLFAYASGITQQIGFVTGVLVLPQRQTVLVAKQAAAVALLSDDRLRLGVGVGWNHVEFAALNTSFSDRGRRQAEQVTLLRALWQQTLVDFTGEWHRVERAALAPRPRQPIPIWFGGLSAAAHERAARLGDGFLFARTPTATGPTGTLDTMLTTGESLRARVSALGRDPRTFGLEGRLTFADGPAAWLREAAAFERAEFDFLAVDTRHPDHSEPADHLAALSAIADGFDLEPS